MLWQTVSHSQGIVIPLNYLILMVLKDTVLKTIEISRLFKDTETLLNRVFTDQYESKKECTDC